MISEVAKINIAGEKNCFKKVIDALHSLGNIEICDFENKKDETELSQDDDITSIEYKLSQLNFAIKFLESKKQLLKEENIKTSLREKILNSKIQIEEKNIKTFTKEYNWEKKITECENAEEKLNNTQNKIKMLGDKKKELEKWKGINISYKRMEETKTTKSFLTEANPKIAKKLNEIFAGFKLVSWEKIKSKNKNYFIIITYNKNIEKSLIEHLEKNNISLIDCPRLEKSSEDEIAKIKNEINKELENIATAHKNIKELIKEEKNLKIIYDWMSWQKTKFKNLAKTFNSSYAFCITAWAAKDNIEKIKKELGKISKNIIIEEIEIKEAENEIPVILKNKIAKPFEMVTSMYGAPLYNEPDPTPYLAPFFTIFFALAITDAMYGVLLAIFAIGAIKFLKIPRENQKLFRIIFWGGIATFIIGALFGGWFGIILENLPPLIGNVLIKIRIINPLVEPVKFLILTFILGIIQVITGLAIAMYWKIKQKKTLDGLLDHGLWIILILSLSLWGATANLPIAGLFKILAIVSTVILVLTQGRDAKNIIMKLLKGLLSLYDITGYFSDILSYSRLLALGLATGIIAMVVNIIAGITMNMIPYIGWLFAIIILISGHLFNIAINVLGAYIHSSRLQYVEFFPKFMEGGGKPFHPFKRECKYVKIVN